MSQAVIVSFYTPEWEYRSRAEQLMRDCDQLGIAHDIRARPSLGNWNRNTAMKPQFIREVLSDHQHVIWLDCDGKLISSPSLCLFQPESVGIAAVPHQTMSNHALSPRAWHTGLISILRRDETQAFVSQWEVTCREQEITDELGFHLVAQQWQGMINPLPASYLRIIRKGRIPANTIYGLGLSESPDKMAMKKRQKAKK